jgi:hypothetical protein
MKRLNAFKFTQTFIDEGIGYLTKGALPTSSTRRKNESRASSAPTESIASLLLTRRFSLIIKFPESLSRNSLVKVFSTQILHTHRDAYASMKPPKDLNVGP